MEHVTSYISLDLGKTMSGIMIGAVKEDTARTIAAYLYKDGKPYAIEDDTTASIKAKFPNGNIREHDCDVENSIVFYDFTEDITGEVGIVECEFCLDSTSGKLTTPRFMIRVEDNISIPAH